MLSHVRRALFLVCWLLWVVCLLCVVCGAFKLFVLVCVMCAACRLLFVECCFLSISFYCSLLFVYFPTWCLLFVELLDVCCL